jgi:1-acyl-sn-glycerol-3-phosphate acyltransferase
MNSRRFLYVFPFIFQTLVWIPTRLVLMVFVRFRVEGTEHLRGFGRNAVIAANHQSELDPILVPASLNPFSKLMPMFYVSRERDFYEKRGIQKYIYGGILFKLWGAYPAYVGKNNYELALRSHINILRDGKTLLVFPEGGKTKDGNIQKGKGGVAYLMHTTDTPIIPLAMKGHFKMTMKNFLFGRRTITLRYGKPIYKRDLFGNPGHARVDATHDDYIPAAQKIMTAISSLYREIH